MTIQWNTVTWYSKLIAVIFFVLTFTFAFYLGTQYEKAWTMERSQTGQYGTDSTGGEYGEIGTIPEDDSVPGGSVDPNISSTITATTSQVTLRSGQTGIFDGFKITLNSVINDYRCPIDVQCIQAGAINTNVTFVSTEGMKTFNMPSDEVPQRYGSYTISIVAVSPPTHSKKKISQSEYLVTFKVLKVGMPQ